MHNVQINIHKTDDSNTVKPTPTPPQEVDFTAVNNKIYEVKRILMHDLNELKEDTKTDLAKIKGDIDGLRHTLIQHDLKIDFNKKHIEKVENQPDTNYQPQLDQMKQRQLLLESTFITPHNRISTLESYGAKIDQMKEKILTLDVQHSNLSLRLENFEWRLDNLTHMTAKSIEPDNTQDPPPEKKTKPDVNNNTCNNC